MPEVQTKEEVLQTEDISTDANQQDFTNPVAEGDLPVNQTANQGIPPEPANPITPNPVEEKQNQASVFGKSELLDAHQILTQILGLQVGNRVADLGAGGGLFTLQAARLVGDQGEVYAVDIIKNILSDIESKARMADLYNIKTVWSNLEIVGATKIPDGTLDFVFMINVLFQSTNTENMLKEAARLLKSGGKMLIIDWSDTSTGMGPDSDRQVDPSKITNEAQKTNLSLEQQFVAGQYHFGLVFIKP